MNKGETVISLNEDGYPVFNADGISGIGNMDQKEVMEYGKTVASLNY